MNMIYDFDDDCRLSGVAFDGLTGVEYVTSVKDALNIMKVKNPAVVFTEDAKAGRYDDVSDEKYELMLETINCIKDLWRYPGEPQDGITKYEMNILMLLANAIEMISRQEAQLRKYRRKQ